MAAYILWVLVAFPVTASFLSFSTSVVGASSRYYLALHFGTLALLMPLVFCLGCALMLVYAFSALRAREYSDGLSSIGCAPIVGVVAALAIAVLFVLPVMLGALTRSLLFYLLGYEVEVPPLPSLPSWWPKLPFFGT